MYRARPASPARRPRRPLLPGSEPAVLTILRYLFHLSCNSFSFHVKVTTFIQRCVSGRGSRELVRSDAAGADHGRITTYSREVSSAAPPAAAAGNTFTTQTMSSSRGTTRSPHWPVRDKPATRMEGARELREWCGQEVSRAGWCSGAGGGRRTRGAGPGCRTPCPSAAAACSSSGASPCNTPTPCTLICYILLV